MPLWSAAAMPPLFPRGDQATPLPLPDAEAMKLVFADTVYYLAVGVLR
jgi:hypothetical protein